MLRQHIFSAQQRLELYEQAQTLYRGALLPGFYDAWVPVEEARLEFAFLHVLRVLKEHATVSGDGARALELGQLIARIEPPPPPGKRVDVLDSAPLGGKGSLYASDTRGDVAPVPSAFTRFFGREDDLQELLVLLGDAQNRVVTLTGGGGLGKTRLALELVGRLEKAAGRQAKTPFERVLWVPLADVSEADLLPETLIKAFNLPVEVSEPEGSVPSLRQRLVHFLRGEDGCRDGRVLLVLDNFEQLLPQGAVFLGQLLESVPLLSLVVTSRKRLGLGGEIEHRVASLALPPLVVPTTQQGDVEMVWCEEQLATLRAASSVQLFADRARNARAGWRLTPHEAPTLVALLQRLEGIPLAIELVASRSGVLSIEQMLSRLSNSWQWVSSRDQHRPLRHRSLGAVLDWSLRLMPPHEREIFARLSVFHGGWTLDDAGAVLSDIEPLALLDALQSLCDASLISSDESKSGALRFSMLEMVRQIAGERLDDAECLKARRRHAEFYFSLAQTAARLPTDEKGRALWSRAEGPNFLAALEFWMEDDLERALGMASSLWWYWVFAYHLPEGRHYFKELLSRPNATDFPVARARAQGGAAYIALLSGYYEEAEEWLQDSMQFWQRQNNTHELVGTFNLLGAIAHARRELDKSRNFYAQSLDLRRQTGNMRELAIALNALAGIEHECGHHKSARRLCAQVLQIADEHGDDGARAWALQTLGLLAREEEDLTEARSLLNQSLQLRQQADHLSAQATCLEALGDIEEQEGKRETARVHYREALSCRRQANQRAQAEAIQQKINDLDCQIWI